MGKKYFKDIAEAWADPRVTLVCGDANVYINECKSEFDVIVSDTSDPDGPARPLFEKPFYQKCKNALRAGGILVTQAENVWLNLELIGTLRANALSIFDDVEYGHFSIPTYPCGCIGYLCCAVNPADLQEGEAYGMCTCVCVCICVLLTLFHALYLSITRTHRCQDDPAPPGRRRRAGRKAGVLHLGAPCSLIRAS